MKEVAPIPETPREEIVKTNEREVGSSEVKNVVVQRSPTLHNENRDTDNKTVENVVEGVEKETDTQTVDEADAAAITTSGIAGGNIVISQNDGSDAEAENENEGLEEAGTDAATTEDKKKGVKKKHKKKKKKHRHHEAEDGEDREHKKHRRSKEEKERRRQEKEKRREERKKRKLERETERVHENKESDYEMRSVVGETIDNDHEHEHELADEANVSTGDLKQAVELQNTKIKASHTKLESEQKAVEESKSEVTQKGSLSGRKSDEKSSDSGLPKSYVRMDEEKHSRHEKNRKHRRESHHKSSGSRDSYRGSEKRSIERESRRKDEKDSRKENEKSQKSERRDKGSGRSVSEYFDGLVQQIF